MDKKEINQFATDVAYKASQWLRTQYYDDFLLCSIKLDWSTKRVSSRGGIYAKGPGINIAMVCAFPRTKNGIYRFYEYPSFDSNPCIGGFCSTDPYHKLEAVVLHEVSHAIQYFSYTKKNVGRDKPHGIFFKNYYKALRNKFLNHKLPDQKSMKKEYQEYCKIITKL